MNQITIISTLAIICGGTNVDELTRLHQLFEELAIRNIQGWNIDDINQDTSNCPLINDNHPITSHFDAIFVITMPKRKEYIKETMEYYGIDTTSHKFHFFDAIQSKLINNDDEITNLYNLNILSPDITWNHLLVEPHVLHNFNEIACSLSHLYVWYSAYINPCINNVLIFEDDISKLDDKSQLFTRFNHVMNTLKNNIDENWEWINFGRCWDNCADDSQKIFDSDDVRIVQSPSSFCAQSYALSRNGLNTIFKNGVVNVLPISRPADVYLIDIFNANFFPHHYSTSSRLFEQNRVELGSNIDQDRAHRKLGSECRMQRKKRRRKDDVSDVSSVGKRIANHKKRHHLVD